MKSFAPGKVTSKVEIQNISTLGLWLYVAGKEFFLPYERHPWFRNARVAEIHNVQLLLSHLLHWPDLDVDLDLDSLEHPERYPLIAKYKPGQESQRKKAA